MEEKQKRGAIVTGLVLGAVALGIYLTVVLKFIA
jgi:hypothetical protein